MLGYSTDAIDKMGAVGLVNLIHADAMNLVFKHYQRFASLRSDDMIVANYRMKRAAGAWCWLHS